MGGGQQSFSNFFGAPLLAQQCVINNITKAFCQIQEEIYLVKRETFRLWCNWQSAALA